MRNRNTYKRGTHKTRLGKIIDLKVTTAKQMEQLSRAFFGNDIDYFSEEQEAMIDDMLQTHWSIREDYIESLTDSMSVIRTLTAMSKLQSDNAEQAYKDCDGGTELLITEALYLDCGVRDDFINPDVKLIPTAATKALDRFKSSPKKRRPSKGPYLAVFADAILGLWIALGGDPEAKAWEAGNGNSTLLRWANVLFAILECKDNFDTKKAKRFMRFAINNKKGAISPL